MAKFRNLLILLVCSVGLLLAASSAKASAAVPPIIVKISSHYEVSGKTVYKPIITGLNRRGTEVLVYFDGTFVGMAKTNTRGNETDNFYFKSTKSLGSGEHSVMVVARDKNSLALSLPKEGLVNGALGNSIAEEDKKQPATVILSAPTLIAPNEKTATGSVKPVITGLTHNGTDVLIYIDGIYNGKAISLNDKSGIASFAYKPFLNLNRGNHAVWALAQDKNGKKSQASKIMNFRIELPMPAPTLLKAASIDSENSRPLVVGLAKNNSKIKIFVDKRLDGEIVPPNHESGTANFAYRVKRGLTNGQHAVYTTASDKRGKESMWSNMISVKAAASKSNTAIDSGKKALSGEEAGAEEAKKQPGAIEGGEKINTEFEKQETGKGLINEQKKNQSRITVNLVIFIAFLIGVIAWILWVNRELIKEKESAEESSGNEKQ